MPTPAPVVYALIKKIPRKNAEVRIRILTNGKRGLLAFTSHLCHHLRGLKQKARLLKYALYHPSY